jgi:hypothetical protein
MAITILKRRKCLVEGCIKLTRNKGAYRGKTRYDNVCEFHHKRTEKYRGEWRIRQKIENKFCENCGWDRAYCDRHRIVPKLGYIRENVKVLCPNCHRLATVGLLTF